MKQLRLPIFNSKIKIYNLRVVPPEPVFDQVVAFKKQFESLYGKQPLSRSKPHITIAAFYMNSKHQELLTTIFDQLAQDKSFQLTLSGFDIFENTKTLYLGVAKSEALWGIYKNVQSLRSSPIKRKLRSFKLSDNPHMTISKVSGRKMLYESLQHFQKNDYSTAFQVNHLTLVSRAKYKTWDWEYQINLA